MHTRLPAVLAAAFVAMLAIAPNGFAATPSTGTIGPLAPSVGWQGQHYTLAATAEEAACPPQALDSMNLVCDHFSLTVAVDPSYWDTNTGSAVVDITWADSSNDFDLYVFDKDGNEVDSSTQGGTTSERATIPRPSGTYDVVVVPFTVVNSGYAGTATFTSQSVAAAPPTSSKWRIVTHGQCCEGNLAASGSTTYVLLPELLTGNEIDRSTDKGQTWQRLYPPADVSVPFGIEGDLRAFGNDITYFGTEVAQGVAAHSDDRGDHWTIVQIPVAFAANDQAWEYMGPVHACPLQLEPYVLTGWYRIGSVALFSCDGGLTWPIQTPLPGVDGSGSAHVVCENTAHDPHSLGDTRIQNAGFANMRAGSHGGWGTDASFYWSEAKDGFLYICKTNTFGAAWEGIRHPLAPGPGQDDVISTLAFDDKGTLYVLHGNKLYVSFDQGESIRYVQTLPRWGSDHTVGDAGTAEWFAVHGGTIYVGLKEAAGPDGKSNIVYLKGKHVDSAKPSWTQELVDRVAPDRLDFMQIVVDGKGIPTISYTTPEDFDKGVTTATRVSP
jgi:hypothetical protein